MAKPPQHHVKIGTEGLCSRTLEAEGVHRHTIISGLILSVCIVYFVCEEQIDGFIRILERVSYHVEQPLSQVDNCNVSARVA